MMKNSHQTVQQIIESMDFDLLLKGKNPNDYHVAVNQGDSILLEKVPANTVLKIRCVPGTQEPTLVHRDQQVIR